MDKALKNITGCLKFVFLLLGEVDPKKVDKINSDHKKSITNKVRNKKFSCSGCDKSFSDSWKLKRHEKTHKKNLEETDSPSKDDKALTEKATNFICLVCNKEFKDNWKVKRHEKTHYKANEVDL